MALGRAALDDSNWPLLARHDLLAAEDPFAEWPSQSGYAVRNMDRPLSRRGLARSG